MSMVLFVVDDTNKESYVRFFGDNTNMRFGDTIEGVLESGDRQKFVFLFAGFFDDFIKMSIKERQLDAIIQKYINILKRSYKRDPEFRIVFFKNDFLLTQYLNDKHIDRPVRVSLVSLIRYIKKQKLVQERLFRIMDDRVVPALVVKDFLYDFKVENILRIKLFSSIPFTYSSSHIKTQPIDQRVLNYESIFRSLSGTDLAGYLK